MSSKKTKPRDEAGIPLSVGWQRILVPIDFSEIALRALDVAVPLARGHKGRLFLLSVVEPAVFAAGMESVAMTVPDSVIAKEAKDNLLHIARRLIPTNVPVTVAVDRGRAWDVITRVAKEQKIDLVV